MKIATRLALGTLMPALAVSIGLAFWLTRQTPAVKPAASQPAETKTGAASSTPAVKKDLQFLFSDDTVAEIADERPDNYTFYIANQFIGVIVLKPSGPGPKSFREWLRGLKGQITVGGAAATTTKVTVAGREALAFQTSNGKDTGQNLMAEVDGQTLWLQSATNQTVLELFLKKLVAVKTNQQQ